MPTTVLACPGCKTKYPWKDELAGRKLKCKKCGQVFQIKAKKAPPGPAAATGQAKPVAAPAANAVTPAEPPNPALGSLLDGELAVAASASAAATANHQPSQAASASPPSESQEPGDKRRCPLCESWVDARSPRCTICHTPMDKKFHDPEAERRKEEAREWLYVLAGLGGALLMTPLLFLVIVLIFGKGSGFFALAICAIEVNYIVAIGCFALACRVFRQEPPEVIDILRVVAYATLSSKILFTWFGGTGLLSTVGATAVAAVVAAGLCMTELEMPVFPSILIGITYNIFSAIFTFIGMVLLALVFAGYLVGTGEDLLLEEPDPTEIEYEDMTVPDEEDLDDFDEEPFLEDGGARAEPATSNPARVSRHARPEEHVAGVRQRRRQARDLAAWTCIPSLAAGPHLCA